MWNAILTFIKEFVDRLSTESPKFFKTLRWICLIIFILLLALILVDQVYPLGLDKIIFGTVTWRFIVGNITTGIAFIFGFTYLPKKDPEPKPEIKSPESTNQ